MAQTYTVTYNIKVNSTSAQQAINSFVNATQKLNQSVASINKLQTALNKLGKTTYSMKFNVGNANRSLDSVLRRLREIDRLAKRNRTITINQGTGGRSRGSSSRNTPAIAPTGGGGRGRVTPQATPKPQGSRSVYAGRGRMPARGNYAYKALGPSMIDSGGIGAIDMLKGMGIMYGITGLGNLMSNILRDSVQYDNTIQTTKNILQSHDNRNNFSGRFAEMEGILRSVGLATKFTAPEVADASKFLAMAGLRVEDINQSIRPVADIALIGDTDLGATADVMTNVMKGYGMSGAQIRSAADVMAMTFTSANTDLMQLAEAYKYAGSILKAGGVSFESSAAAFGVLGNAGLQGSHGGTTMRMIMNNLANPTKKQQKEWDALGINTKGADGKIRPLQAIFRDLNERGVGLEEMTRLFRITAAPGAVVLAQNIDEWDKITRENFASNGLSSRLALAKQNTIQGLWAQITSQFTENGLEVFEGKQSQIRSFMVEVLNWVRSPEMKQYMAEFGQMFIDLIKLFKGFTETLLETYHRFGPLIQVWLKLQLQLSAVLIPLRVFRSLMNFGGLLFTGARSLGVFSGALGRLLVSMRSVSSFRGQWEATKASLSHGLGWTAMNLGYIPQGGFKSFTSATGKIHNNVDKATMLRYQQMAQSTQKYQAWRTASAGMLGTAGGVIGGMLGSQIGEVGSGLNMAATLGGSMLGAAGFGAMGSIPIVGWACAAGAAAVFAAYKIYEGIEAAKAGHQAFQDYINSSHIENGILTGDGMDVTQRYYELAYNKSLSLTELAQKRVDLLQEELGLQNGVVKDDEGKYIDRQQLDKVYGLAQDADSIWGSTNMAMDAAALLNGMSTSGSFIKFTNQGGYEVDPKKNNGRWRWRGANGEWMTVYNPLGTSDDQDVLAANSALFSEGMNGTESKKIRDEFQNRLRALLLTNGSLADVMDIRNEWANRFAYENYIGKSDANTFPNAFSLTTDLTDTNVWTGAQIAQAYAYRQGVVNMMNPLFGVNAPVWAAAQNYYAGLQNQNLGEQQVVEFMRYMDVTLAGVLAGYTSEANKVNEWMESLGLKDGKFDKNAQDLAELQKQFQDILNALNQLPVPAQNAASNLFSLVNNLNNIAGAQLWYNNLPGSQRASVTGTGAETEDKRTINGMTYRYNGAQWKAINSDGSENTIILPVSDKSMAQMLGSTGASGSGRSTGVNNLGTHTPQITTPTGGKGGKGNGTGGADSSQYKNHYQSQNAAPKQVIVRIGNLMNVQSVDLTNKDNAAVIDNLKGQLTQALVDVVHDFDETWNG